MTTNTPNTKEPVDGEDLGLVSETEYVLLPVNTQQSGGDELDGQDTEALQRLIMKWRLEIRQLESQRLRGDIDKRYGSDLRDAEINKGLAADLMQLIQARERAARVDEAKHWEEKVVPAIRGAQFQHEIDKRFNQLKPQAGEGGES